MGDGDKTAPIVTEFLGWDQKAATPPGEQPSGGKAVAPSPDPDQSVCPPLHRMHEQRLVRRAGRMVVGVRMPTPQLIEAQASRVGGQTTPVFYSHEERRAGGGVSRTTLVVACAFALGSSVVLTEKFAGSDRTARIAPAGDVAADVTSAIPGGGKPVQLLTMSDTPAAANTRMAALSPGMVADRASAPASNFTRVAQKDSQGLGASDVFGPAGAPIRLPISLNGARPEDYSFLMFRGLPPEVTLSAGFRLKESWAVSLRDMDNLSIETPAEFQGSFKLEILLIKGRDTPAESRMITVEVVPSDIQLPPSTASRQAAPGPQVLTAAPRTIDPVERSVQVERSVPATRAAPAARSAPGGGSSSSLSSQQEEMMMRRATTLLESKDVMAARLLLEHLANNGSAQGALAMGKTFDPAYLKAMGTGIKPDVAKARQWYRRAAELGDIEAPSRLNGLASR
jgi:hypothetical protein